MIVMEVDIRKLLAQSGGVNVNCIGFPFQGEGIIKRALPAGLFWFRVGRDSATCLGAASLIETQVGDCSDSDITFVVVARTPEEAIELVIKEHPFLDPWPDKCCCQALNACLQSFWNYQIDEALGFAR